MAGQLAALAGLGALGHLDLQHLGVDQILRRHAETAGGDLLDFRVLLGLVARRILPALAGIRTRTQAVHGDGQRLVRLRRQCAQGHAGAVEAREDSADRFDLLECDAGCVRLQFQKIPQARDRPLIDELGKLLVAVVIARHDRGLQRGDHVRVVHVVLAAVHVLEQPSLFDAFVGVPGARCEVLRIVLQVGEVRPLDAAVGALEAQRDHLVGEADDLEQLGAAVARNRRYAHLGHHLEQPLADSAAVASPQFAPRIGLHIQRALAHQVEQGLIGEVRIDRSRTVADQAGEVMRIARRAGFHQDVALAAQSGCNQPVMHRAGGQQGMDRQLVLDRIAVGKQQHQLAVAHRRLGLIAHRQNRVLEVELAVVLQIDELVRNAGIRQGHDLAQLALRENGRA